jgi:hypothetical protein
MLGAAAELEKFLLSAGTHNDFVLQGKLADLRQGSVAALPGKVN